MYVIRRVWTVKPGEARRAATIVAEIGKHYEHYEAAGKRSPSRVYFNNGTVPGEKNLVYMEWTEESIESPYRPGTSSPEVTKELGAKLNELALETRIEFYEMMTPEKALDIS
jgi:hypothetical protein